MLFTYGIICATQVVATMLAHSYEMGGGLLIRDRQDHAVEVHQCVPYHDFKGTIAVEGDVVHGDHGSFKVVGVRLHPKDKLVWTFLPLYPQESYGI